MGARGRQADPACGARRLSRGATWSCRHAQAPAQRRPPGVCQVLIQAAPSPSQLRRRRNQCVRRTLMKPALPKPIAEYVKANAQLDVDRMLKPFAPDAVLLDNGKRLQGHAELRALFEDEVIPVKAIFTPDAVRHEGGQVVVRRAAQGD